MTEVTPDANAQTLPPTLTAPVAAESKPPKPARIAVTATRRGYYANVERNKGDKFFLKSETEFSERWMKKEPAKLRPEAGGQSAS